MSGILEAKTEILEELIGAKNELSKTFKIKHGFSLRITSGYTVSSIDCSRPGYIGAVGLIFKE